MRGAKLLFSCGAAVATVASAQQLDCHPGAARPSPPEVLPTDPGYDPGDDDATIKTECDKFGCTMVTPSNPLAPKCVYPDGFGYTSSDSFDAASGSATLTQSSNYVGRYLASGDTSPTTVNFQAQAEGTDRLRLYFSDSTPRYEIPENVIKLNDAVQSSNTPHYKVKFDGAGGPGGIFSLEVYRNYPGRRRDKLWKSSTPVLTANLPGFSFDPQFLEISFRLPTDIIYGFGEHEHVTLKHSFDYFYLPMFNRAHFVQPHNGNNEYPNLYGQHPFFMGFDADGYVYGVLFWNSNAQEVFLQPDNILTYRTIGGVLDIRVMFGPTPAEVIKQYHQMIGTPYFPPYWSLGFQLSKYYYGSLDTVKALTERMHKYRMYWDVQHLDIDYMDRQRDFTVDTDGSFDGLRQHVLDIQGKDYGYMKAVVILDPAITSSDETFDCSTAETPMPTDYPPRPQAMEANLTRSLDDALSRHERFGVIDDVTTQDCNAQKDPTYHAWIQGKADDVFLKIDVGGTDEILLGKVWPDYPNSTKDVCHSNAYTWDNSVFVCRGESAWPDWGKQAAHDWWVDEVKTFHTGGSGSYGEGVPFDGIWIDMNEPESFVQGSRNYWNQNSYACETDNQYEVPPYLPHLANRRDGIQKNTICMNAKHTFGSDTYLSYNVHSLYGHSMAAPTLAAANAVRSERSMVFSRSSFVGTGALIGHWLGDNQTSWAALKYSIIGMLEFNIFGITYVGSDICGFFGIGEDTDLGKPDKSDRASPELCYRWQQLGAFYTFSRNHGTKYKNEQDPAQYADDVGEEFADAVKRAYKIRYELMPYLYSTMYDAHKNGGTVLRTLFEEFWQDNNTYVIDEDFLWGGGLMISPIVEEGQIERKIYLPAGRWYDYYTHDERGSEAIDEGREHIFQSPIENFAGDIPVHIHGGHILTLQEPYRTLTLSRNNPMSLIVALDEEYKASGHLHWDSGDSILDDPAYQGLDVYLNFENAVLTSLPIATGGFHSGLHFESIKIIGVNFQVKQVVSGGIVNSWYWTENRSIVLIINPVSIDEGFTIKIIGFMEDYDASIRRTAGSTVFAMLCAIVALLAHRY